jgi:hypothetical protein
MDHHYIEQYDLVDRYLMGKLAAEESAPFEEHFVDCTQCLDRLKTAGDFLQGMRAVTVEQVSSTEGYKSRGRLWYLTPMLSRKALALAASFLLAAAAVGAVLALRQMRRFQLEAHEATSAAAQWERRYEEEQQSAAQTERKREQTEQELTAQLRELEAKLEDVQKQRAPLASESGWWTQPGINVPVFALNSARAGDPSSGAMNEIALSRSPMGFVISLGLAGEVKYRDYRITILDNRNRVVWKRGGFKPDSHNALSIGFNSTFFRPGQYLLTVEGRMRGEDITVLGSYPFRVIKNT